MDTQYLATKEPLSIELMATSRQMEGAKICQILYFGFFRSAKKSLAELGGSLPAAER